MNNHKYWYMISADGQRAFLIEAETRDEAFARLVAVTGQDGSEMEMTMDELFEEVGAGRVVELGNPL